MFEHLMQQVGVLETHLLGSHPPKCERDPGVCTVLADVTRGRAAEQAVPSQQGTVVDEPGAPARCQAGGTAPSGLAGARQQEPTPRRAALPGA